MRSSYQEEDVILLLKDITGLVEPQPTREREKLIQAGKHYCEMLPIEYSPSQAYLDAYYDALQNYAKPTAQAVGRLADRIVERKGKNLVLVSLARAGIPIGILLKRYILWKYGVNAPHYSLSIIRGRGIDKNAMNFILNRHEAKDVLFVDGWIGKGAIQKELNQAMKEYPEVSGRLAAAADPANVTDLFGTREDILIPSSCLNCTVSGLLSRTFLRKDIIGENDFHGAVFYEALRDQDVSYEFINAIVSHFTKENQVEEIAVSGGGREEVEEIAGKFGISDCNLIKPGIGETTRVLLRRVPFCVLIREDCREDKSLTHLKKLAEEKEVPIRCYPLRHYKACGIIKKLADA